MVRVEIFFSALLLIILGLLEDCMGKVSDQVFQLAVPLAQSIGLEVLEVLYEKKSNGMNLTIVIDKDEGVSLDDCERMHHLIDAPLDELDPIDCSYTLNISSPGIDRPLKTERDYRRNVGQKILVKLYKPLNGKKNFEGILVEFDDETFSIQLLNKQIIKFYKKDTAKVEPVIEF